MVYHEQNCTAGRKDAEFDMSKSNSARNMRKDWGGSTKARPSQRRLGSHRPAHSSGWAAL